MVYWNRYKQLYEEEKEYIPDYNSPEYKKKFAELQAESQKISDQLRNINKQESKIKNEQNTFFHQYMDPNMAELEATKSKLTTFEQKSKQLSSQRSNLPEIKKADHWVNRTIIYILPNGTKSKFIQMADMYATATIYGDHTDYSDWTTGTWKEFSGPFVPGYITPIAPTITVYWNTKDQQVTYTYTAEKKPQEQVNKGKIQSIKLVPWRSETSAMLQVDGWHVFSASQQLKNNFLILKDMTTGEILDVSPYQGLASPDIHSQYPDISGSGNASFSVGLKLPLANLGDSLVLIARATDGDFDSGTKKVDYTFELPKPDMGNYGALTEFVAQNGVLHVRGWHATNLAPGSNHIIILYDVSQKRVVAQRVVENPQEQTNIAEQYPTIYNARYSGFDVSFDLTPDLTGDQLQIISRWNNTANPTKTVDFRYAPKVVLPIKLGNANNAWLDQMTIQNGRLHVVGWHATNKTAGRVHTIILYDATRNQEITRQTIDQVSRPDVANRYHDINNAGMSGFSADFDVTPAMLNDQVLIISRWSGNDTNKDYVDYWFPARQVLSGTDNIGWLDQMKIVNGKLHVSGWHATNQAINRPYHTVILFDASQNREINRITIKSTARPDVARAYPQIFNAGVSEFSADFELTPAMANDNLRVISRWSGSKDTNENYVDYWFEPHQVITDRGNYAYLDNISSDNGELFVSGWHATNQAIGKKYHYIIAVDQNTGKEIQRQIVQDGISRPDVAKSYSAVVNAKESGFKVAFDLTQAFVNAKLAFISRWTDDAAGNGNYTDYWFKPMINLNTNVNRVSDNYGYLDSQRFMWNTLQVTGWHVSDKSLVEPYRTLIIVDNTVGKEVGRASNLVSISRPDLAKKFSNIMLAGQAGFSAKIKLDDDINPYDDFTLYSRYSLTEDANENYTDYAFHLGQLAQS